MAELSEGPYEPTERELCAAKSWRMFMHRFRMRRSSPTSRGYKPAAAQQKMGRIFDSPVSLGGAGIEVNGNGAISYPGLPTTNKPVRETPAVKGRKPTIPTFNHMQKRKT